MDWNQIYHFLFETYEGIGCMVAACLVISVLACIIMEKRTRKVFKDRKKTENDDWSIFDDDDDAESGGASS